MQSCGRPGGRRRCANAVSANARHGLDATVSDWRARRFILVDLDSDPERLSVPTGLATSGEPPSLVTPPIGCRLPPRCPMVMDVCRQASPPRSVGLLGALGALLAT